MPQVSVGTLDPREAGFERWYEVVAAASAELWPGEPGWLPDELAAPVLDPRAPEERVLVAARLGQEIAGACWVDLPRRDNLDSATASLCVHPAYRRRGVGSAVLAGVEELAFARGRTKVVAWLEEPSLLKGRSPGRFFARHHGYRCVQVAVRRHLALPVDARRLALLQSQAWRRAAGYELVSWVDHCPEEFVERRALFGAKMSTDPPAGDMGHQEEQWDATRVRALEELAGRQGRTLLVCAARHQASEELVAFSELAIPAVPQVAYQHDTLVLADHRGHRLGMLVKVANLRSLQAASPATEKVCTSNAWDNPWMIAVNEALGFDVVGTEEAWSKDLAGPSSPAHVYHPGAVTG